MESVVYNLGQKKASPQRILMKLELWYMCESAAYLLFAVNLAARVMLASLLIWMVGESVLPVLRELECREKTLG